MPPQVGSARPALPLWLASVPDPVTPTEGRDAAQRALDDAAAVLNNIRDRFAGTLPPPPWPESPAVEAARRDVEIARDGFATLADHSAGLTTPLAWPKGTGKYGPMLVRVGTALYTRLAELEEHAATSESLPEFLAKLPTLPAPFAGLSALVVLGLGYLAYREIRGVRRLIEGS